MEWTTFWPTFSQTHLVTLILVGLGIDEVGIFNGRSEYFRTICHFSSPFGILCGNFFPRFGMLHREKSGNLGGRFKKMKRKSFETDRNR
jgi:hypothetical protein